MTNTNSQQGAHLTAKISGLIPIVSVIVAMALGWGELRNQVTAQEKFREELTTYTSKMEDRIRYLENQGSRMDERFNLILQGVTELKTQINDLSEKARR